MKLPGHALAHQIGRAAGFTARRIQSEIFQQDEREERMLQGPCFEICLPSAIGGLRGEKACAPTLLRDPRALRGDDILRCMEHIAHDLPTDRRVCIQQPIHDRFLGTPVLPIADLICQLGFLQRYVLIKHSA